MAIKIPHNPHCLKPVEIFLALTEKLHVPSVITPNVYKLLTSDNLLDESYHMHEQLYADGNAAMPTGSRNNKQISPSETLYCDLLDKNMSGSLNIANSVNSGSSGKTETAKLLPDADKLKTEQQECESLKVVFQQVKQGKGNYISIDDLIYHKDKISGENVTQLVIPKTRREQILKLAH